jgi:hypothetical protein
MSSFFCDAGEVFPIGSEQVVAGGEGGENGKLEIGKQKLKRGRLLIREKGRLSDYFHETAGGALLREQGQDGSIHGGELGLLVHGKPEQVGVGDLLVTRQPPGERLSGLHETDFVRPEAMRRVVQVGGKKFQCFRRCYGIA